jgi:uncharacterized protein YoxC
MPWYVVLIIALASLAFVVAVGASVGLRASRVVKHGTAVAGRVGPLVDGLTRRSDEIAAAAERLSADAEQLEQNLARMRRSLARLQVITRNFNEALRPYYVIRGWLSGERGWSDLGI